MLAFVGQVFWPRAPVAKTVAVPNFRGDYVHHFVLESFFHNLLPKFGCFVLLYSHIYLLPFAASFHLESFCSQAGRLGPERAEELLNFQPHYTAPLSQHVLLCEAFNCMSCAYCMHGHMNMSLMTG